MADKNYPMPWRENIVPIMDAEDPEGDDWQTEWPWTLEVLFYAVCFVAVIVASFYFPGHWWK